jgi:hypothetical protein
MTTAPHSIRKNTTAVLVLAVIFGLVPAATAQTGGGTPQPPAKKSAQVDDSNARPPVAEVDLLIMKRADEILDSEAKWNRADTRVCPDTAKTFSLYCVLEKASKEVDTFQHRSAVMQETRFVIDEIAPNRNYDHRLMGYNNDPTTTFADIKKIIRLTQERIAARLKDDPRTNKSKL